MKKHIISTLVIFAILLSLSGCSGGIGIDEAKAHINDFLDTLETKDYEKASTFLHPERPGDLKTFFEGLEKEKGLDFSSIEINEFTGFSVSLYDSTVGGSTCSLGMELSVSGKDIEMEIEIVRNDNGFGIYNLDIDA